MMFIVRTTGDEALGAALERGVYFHYAWHHGFSAMHTLADLDEALSRIEDAVRSMQKP